MKNDNLTTSSQLGKKKCARELNSAPSLCYLASDIHHPTDFQSKKSHPLIQHCFKNSMLKAIQILSSSSSFVAYRWKPHPTYGFILVSSTSLSYSKLSPFSTSKTTPSRPISTNFIRSHSNMDGASSATSPPPPPPSSSSGNARKISFCQWCGGPMKFEIPDGDEKKRAICSHCGKIAYQNPKMVVGCLVEHDNKVLLCKRNIEPSYGLWTLPAGYLELGESAAEGAIRETWEEAFAEVEVVSPFTQLDIPLIGQTYVIFLAKLKKPQFSPGPESLECRLFSLEDIPFDSLAFSSMLVTLNLYAEDVKAGKLQFHYGTINKRPGTSPSDIRAYTLDYHLQS